MNTIPTPVVRVSADGRRYVEIYVRWLNKVCRAYRNGCYLFVNQCDELEASESLPDYVDHADVILEYSGWRKGLSNKLQEIEFYCQVYDALQERGIRFE